MGKPSAKQPDPVATAQAQSDANRQAAFDSAQLNQINQVSPFGATYYTGEIGGPDRTQFTALSPQLQGIVGGLLGQIQGARPLDFGSLPGVGLGEDARQAVTQATFDRAAGLLRPGQERAEADARNRLWQQGLAQGSEAYDEELNRLDRSRAQQMNDLSLASVLSGSQAGQQQFAQQMAARQQALAEQQLQSQHPIGALVSLLSGTAPGGVAGMPQVAQYGLQSPDITGMTGSNYAAQANQRAATQGGLLGLLGNLGGAAIGAWA